MKLADYIRTHHELILCEWEAFARQVAPAAGMTKALLRDHAEEILTAIVSDMETRETPAETKDKSEGNKAKVAPGKGSKGARAKGAQAKGARAKAAPGEGSTGAPADGAEPRTSTAAAGALGQVHATLRIASGFTLSQIVSEYRALRASVFRLWGKSGPDPHGVLRFNEAIDEALADAVDGFTEKTTQYRDQVIAIVSHDLRNPLGGILMGAAVLGNAEGLDDKSARIVTRIERSANRMLRIVGDLLDLTRTRLGAEIPIVKGPADLGSICDMVVYELEGSHPNAVIRYASEGDLRGEWDRDRLAQVFSNLVGNALQHGDQDQPVLIDARADGKDVVVAVHNAGPPIPDSALQNIFDPMVHGLQAPGKRSTSLGLGLYIAKQLVISHAGTLDVASTDADGTTFTVRLPRGHVPPAANPGGG